MAQRAKIFLLGLGCHKGGSTWLHRHLASLPECNFGVTKEYHTFDTRYLDLFRHFHEDDLRRLPRLFERRRKRWFWQRGRYDRLIEKLAHKVVFHNDPALYAAYFDGLWSRDTTASVVGDVTPGYAALRAEHFKEIKRLLEAMAERPTARLADLSPLKQDERRQLLTEWNPPAEVGGEEQAESLSRLFEEQVEKTPAAGGVEYLEEKATYRELNRRANRVAHVLAEAGVGPDTIVALLDDRGIDLKEAPVLAGTGVAGEGASTEADDADPGIRAGEQSHREPDA